jgi:hypothetical protein
MPGRAGEFFYANRVAPYVFKGHLDQDLSAYLFRQL